MLEKKRTEGNRLDVDGVLVEASRLCGRELKFSLGAACAV